MGARGRGNKSSQSQIQTRRRRLTKLMGKGLSTGEAEIVLQRECNPEEFEKLREVQLRILERMEEFLLAEKIDLETAREWRAIRQDILVKLRLAIMTSTSKTRWARLRKNCTASWGNLWEGQADVK